MRKRSRPINELLAQDIAWCSGIVVGQAQRMSARTPPPRDDATATAALGPTVIEENREAVGDPAIAPGSAAAAPSGVEHFNLAPVPTDLSLISLPLLKGELGDISVSLRLRSSYSILREPDRFAGLQEPSGIELFVYIHSSPSALYVQRGRASLLMLTALLASPLLSVTIFHSKEIYSLLFSFLGSERVTISPTLNDVSVMASLVHGTLPSHDCIDDFKRLVKAVFPDLFDAQNAAPCSESTFYIRDDLVKLQMLKDVFLHRIAAMAAQRSLLCDTRGHFMCSVMHYHGFPVDRKALSESSAQIDSKVHECEVKARSLLTTNTDLGAVLPADSLVAADATTLGDLLLDTLKLRELLPAETRDVIRSVAAIDALAPHNELAAILKRGRYLLYLREHLLNTLSTSLVQNTRFCEQSSTLSWSVHPHFSLLLSKTGRIHTSRPNLQGYPRGEKDESGIRRAFVAPRGTLLVSLDYSQIELRLLAHLSDDVALRKLFHSGGDVLAAIAAEVFHTGVSDAAKVSPSQRQSVKTIVYGLIYGMGDSAMNEQLSALGSQMSASILRAAFLGRFPDVKTYLFTASTRDPSLLASTLLGRPRFMDVGSTEKRQAISTVVQGSAADLLKDSMWRLHKWRLGQSLGAFALLLTVHDEVVAAVPCASTTSPRTDPKFCFTLASMKEIMEDPKPMGLDVPLSVGVRVGPSLAELQDFPL